MHDLLRLFIIFNSYKLQRLNMMNYCTNFFFCILMDLLMISSQDKYSKGVNIFIALNTCYLLSFHNGYNNWQCLPVTHKYIQLTTASLRWNGKYCFLHFFDVKWNLALICSFIFVFFLVRSRVFSYSFAVPFLWYLFTLLIGCFAVLSYKFELFYIW